MIIAFPSQWLPGFLCGCLLCGIIWQQGRPGPPAAIPVGIGPLAAAPPESPAPSPIPTLDAAGLTQAHAALLGHVIHDRSRAALDLLASLGWADTAALLKLPCGPSVAHHDRQALTNLLLAHLFMSHTPSALTWVMEEAPAESRLAWLDHYLTYWKKRQPADFQRWLDRHREILRPPEAGNAIWAGWQPAPVIVSPGPPPATPPLDRVFEDLEGELKRGKWTSAPLLNWGRLTGQWQAAMDRASQLEDESHRQGIESALSPEWAKANFQEWSQWADTQPEKQRTAHYHSNLRSLSIQLRNACAAAARRAPDAATDQLIKTFLQPSVIGKIAATPSPLPWSDTTICLVEAWLIHAPEAAAAWLAAQPFAPWQDGLKQQQALRLGQEDPVAALALATAITDPKPRRQTMNQIYLNWSHLESQAAAAHAAEYYPDQFPAP